jgi:hypothetical protein
MQTVLNSRAKMPRDLAVFAKQYKISHRDLLSTNPKTEKSKIQTYILHLAPADISGVNVCPGAGNCRKICLHFAGNPVYMTNKQKARIRRTLSFAAENQRFVQILIMAILDKINKNPGESIAVRLNGTSDILWENVDLTITPEFSTFCRVKFGHQLPIGKRNIFEIFNIIATNNGPRVVFYDYTKIKRNWAECKRLGYHITASFDGWGNAANLKICRDALKNGVNVAAAFNLKKGQDLPHYVSTAGLIDGANDGQVFAVYDGDLSDFRPADPSYGTIIGLRFKLPHGIKYTEAEKKAFCIA